MLRIAGGLLVIGLLLGEASGQECAPPDERASREARIAALMAEALSQAEVRPALVTVSSKIREQGLRALFEKKLPGGSSFKNNPALYLVGYAGLCAVEPTESLRGPKLPKLIYLVGMDARMEVVPRPVPGPGCPENGGIASVERGPSFYQEGQYLVFLSGVDEASFSDGAQARKFINTLKKKDALRESRLFGLFGARAGFRVDAAPESPPWEASVSGAFVDELRKISSLYGADGRLDIEKLKQLQPTLKTALAQKLCALLPETGGPGGAAAKRKSAKMGQSVGGSPYLVDVTEEGECQK
jgi:hypothetical protein